jgi:hypothetical protein
VPRKTPHTPPVHSPTRGGVENATLRLHTWPYQQAFLIDRETWLHAAVCRRVTVCRGRPRHGCRLSLALHTSSLSIHSHLAGRYNLSSSATTEPTGRRSNATGRVHCTLDIWYSLGICFTPVEPLSPRIHDDTYSSSMINLVPQTSLPIPYIPKRPWPGPQS